MKLTVGPVAVHWTVCWTVHGPFGCWTHWYLLGDLEASCAQYGVSMDINADQKAPAYNDVFQIGLAANYAWNKLNVYYSLTDSSPY
jgi:hypothetical protein